MNSKTNIVTSAADGCGQPSSIRTMDYLPSRDHKGAEYKESFMLTNRSSVSRGFILTAAAAMTVTAIIMFTVGNARANLILNGDFSANASSYTTWPGYSSATGNPANPTDWTATDTLGNTTGGLSGINGTDTGFYSNPPSGQSPEPFAPISTDGITDFLFLQGGAVTGGGLPIVSQTVATTAGQAYTLNYAGAARSGETADVLAVMVTDATNSNQIAVQTPAISDTAFSNFTLNFTAPSASTTIAFSNETPNGGGSVDVTDVSLNPVPEPATLELVTMGGLGLLLLKRRRA
ncbi:MAG: DUF642 domain-containing protein [Planctomycetia bacterium]|nr:DUF642 domain-containing protein [Planctomycetia bacterium]